MDVVARAAASIKNQPNNQPNPRLRLNKNSQRPSKQGGQFSAGAVEQDSTGKTKSLLRRVCALEVVATKSPYLVFCHHFDESQDGGVKLDFMREQSEASPV